MNDDKVIKLTESYMQENGARILRKIQTREAVHLKATEDAAALYLLERQMAEPEMDLRDSQNDAADALLACQTAAAEALVHAQSNAAMALERMRANLTRQLDDKAQTINMLTGGYSFEK